VRERDDARQFTLVSTGSEVVSVSRPGATGSPAALHASGALPCWRALRPKPLDYRTKVLSRPSAIGLARSGRDARWSKYADEAIGIELVRSVRTGRVRSRLFQYQSGPRW